MGDHRRLVIPTRRRTRHDGTRHPRRKSQANQRPRHKVETRTTTVRILGAARNPARLGTILTAHQSLRTADSTTRSPGNSHQHGQCSPTATKPWQDVPCGLHRRRRTRLPIALATYEWYKAPFESLVRRLFADAPAALGGLNFADPKRGSSPPYSRRCVGASRSINRSSSMP